MTQDEIIEMAIEAELVSPYKQYKDWIDAGPSGKELVALAKLIAKKVRFEAADDAWMELVKHGIGWELRKAVTDRIHARDEK